MMLGEARFEEVMSGFRRHAFRLETLDVYNVGEDNEVARYLRGELAPDPEDQEPWLATLRAERAAGKMRQRVHVLRGPLTSYLRYECEWGYLPNTAAGEDVRILDLAERPRPAGLDVDHDFWLLDDSDVLRMHYDAGGGFLGAEILGEEMLPRYLAARDAALGAAEPFASYWRRHPEYHQVPPHG
jgi:hypothetical protein